MLSPGRRTSSAAINITAPHGINSGILKIHGVEEGMHVSVLSKMLDLVFGSLETAAGTNLTFPVIFSWAARDILC